MNTVAVVAAVAVAVCALCAAAIPVAGRRRDAPEEDHRRHHRNNSVELEDALIKFLDVYYDRYVRPPVPPPPPPPKRPVVDIYDQMQSDQPVTHNPDFLVGNDTDYVAMKRGWVVFKGYVPLVVAFRGALA